MPPISELRESITMEHAILVLIISVSLFMFLESFRFASAAQTFPQFTTLVAIVFGFLVLFRDLLPEIFRQYTTDSTKGTRSLEILHRDVGPPNFHTRDREPLITGGLTVGYLFGSIVIGLLWTTPLFVLAYTLWKNQPWHRVALLTVASFALAYLFMTTFQLPIHRGVVL